MKRLASGLSLLLVLGVVACGSDTTEPAAEVSDDLSGDVAQTETLPGDTAPDPTGTEVTDITGDPAPVDVAGEEIVFEDIIPDKTPPEVVKTVPANEAGNVAIPFTVQVTFSENIRFKETVDKSSFQVTDINGQALDGTFTYDETTFTVTWTPKAGLSFLQATPYKVTLTTIIQDKVGNHLKDYVTFSFSTALPPKLNESYAGLAAKYSPLVYQATSKTTPQFDYPTSYDFDGQWKAMLKDSAIKKAVEIPAWIYWDLVETKTHYFIRYAYYYPIHAGSSSDDNFSNDLSGVTVVVEKRPTERPIAVETYYGRNDIEEMLSFITTESGLVPNPSQPSAVLADGVLAQSQLFPGGHFQSYLRSATHQSCAWAVTVAYNSQDRCVLTASDKTNLPIVQMAYTDGTAGSFKKGTGGFPTSTTDAVGYGLRSVMGDWWVRRDHVGTDSIFSATFSYEAAEGQPGNGMVLPGTFLDSVNPASSFKGRPPWAWGWEPGNGVDYLPIGRGIYYIDPEYFFAKRHKVSVGMNAQKVGYSDIYCFNPYLLIDQRGKDGDCSPMP